LSYGVVIASQFRPQNWLRRPISTSALYWPMSYWEKGWRTQFVAETVSGSMAVTRRPWG